MKLPGTLATVNWLKVKALPSTSLSLDRTFPLRFSSSKPTKLSSIANGASLTAIIVILRAPVSVPPLPSLMR